MTGALVTIGGVGLFLLGMVVLTDGLKDLASGTMRRILARFTRSPSTGAMAGALTTALIQSSSATTVAAVGFVSAGVLTFAQALGIVLGANVGTTITGWLVVLVGFKLDLGQVLLPLILAGAAMRLFGKPRTAAAGMALAGFGLIFVGIDTLQQGLLAYREVLRPDTFPPDTWGGRALLVVFGIAMTLITQSSSSGVATALAAVHIGTISLPQAAAIVVGMDVGTTATAALATVGGRVAARRTGFAHVIYNCMTGVAAFLVLPVFIRAWESAFGARAEAELALVSFHTFFNFVGLIVVLPFATAFERLTERLFPDHDELGRRLDPNLLQTPALAIDVAFATARDIAEVLMPAVEARLCGARDAHDRLWEELGTAVAELQRYVGGIGSVPTADPLHVRRLAVLHAADHLDRLVDRCRAERALSAVRAHPDVAPLVATLRECLDVHWSEDADDALEVLARTFNEAREPFRATILGQSAAGALSTDDTLTLLDGHRWLAHVANHCFRIVHHLTRPEVDVTRMPED